MSRVYAACAAGDREGAAAALDDAEVLARDANRGRELVKPSALRAILVATGEAAESLFAESISLARSGGLIRAYADTSPQVCAEAVKRGAPGGISTTAPGTMGSSADKPPQDSAGLCATILTPKEHEVLRLLASRLPNKRIAEALDVSSETVKWHLRNVFAKLNAGNREHAVHRARMLGIL